MNKKITSLSLAIFAIAFIATKPVMAWDIPTFTSCTEPQGELIASYDTGIHGIIGQDPQEGSDYVYKLTDTTVTQCFCPTEGASGIQTDWWKVTELTQEEIDELVSQGWFYIPNGADWGLDQAPYVARNSEFSCGEETPTPTPTEEPTPTPTESVTPTPTPTPEDKKEEKKEEGKEQVLGLAATGNVVELYTLLFTGASSLISGFALRKYNK